MAVIRKWSGDGVTPQPLTTTATTAGSTDNPFDFIGGDPAQVVASGPRPPSIQCSNVNGNGCFPQWRLAAPITACAGRLYVTMPDTWPSASQTIIATNLAGDLVHSIRIGGSGQPGQLRVMDNSNAQVAATPSGVFALSTRYRIEWTIDFTTGASTMRAFDGDTTTQLATLPYTGDFGTSFDRMSFGMTNASPVTNPMLFDDIALADTADEIGPYVAAGPVALAFTMWDGTSEVPMVVTIWDGTQETPAGLALS